MGSDDNQFAQVGLDNTDRRLIFQHTTPVIITIVDRPIL